MMKKISVNLKQKSYDIVVGNKSLDQLPKFIKLLDIGKNAVVVTHPMIWRWYGKSLTAALIKGGFSVDVITVRDGETSKSAACAIKVIEQLAKLDVDKKIFCIAFGGGVVGDLTGFVAAVYKRGIPYIQVPTSLLAQVDSSIGGKTAIDLNVGKNLVGAFYQPRLVFSDTALLATLSDRQMRNGLAEIIKYGIIKDPALFAFIEKNLTRFLKHDPAVLTHLILTSSQIKACVVERDEFETKGIRSILNFGHTVGHAIEAGGGFSTYQHGEAIALGMRIAARLSVLLKQLSPVDEKRINDVIDAAGLPTRVKGVSLAVIRKHMRHDKKFVAGQNRFIIAHQIGRVSVQAKVPDNLIDQAIQAFL